MRILLVNTFYYPNIIGGTENSVKILAENLIKYGHEVAVYCADNIDKKDNIKKENINGVHVYRGTAGAFSIDQRLRINNSKYTKIKNKLIELRNYTIRDEVKYIINDFKPQVVHTNNLFGISPYIWKIFNENNIKIVHTLRDYWLLSPKVSLENGRNLIEKSLIKIYRAYFRDCSKYVDYVTAPSKFTLNVFKENKYFKNAKFIHINNAIEIDNNLLCDIIENRKKNNSNVIRFLFAGMLIKNKGIDKLIEVFHTNKNPNIRLSICGEGSLEKMVVDYSNIDKRIIYKGKLKKEELCEEFKRNDVIIVPSMWDEPFGRVILEANQFGLPVIGSNRGGIKEILDQINSGILFNCNNLSELNTSIDFFADRNNIKLFYKNIKDNINTYSIENQIRKFEDIYNKSI